ncbi:hypothetical protein SAMN04489806_2641 [Paramicrobacterium humi]|uniref:Uncharacterized protein n=2 Tax=Paramicrobacterium humi TaxID=640635 RepID=A0A1H4PXB4_9MICO|nr:hypothetical protein SAMN04489806_2641 [Microbacterium humi]
MVSVETRLPVTEVLSDGASGHRARARGATEPRAAMTVVRSGLAATVRAALPTVGPVSLTVVRVPTASGGHVRIAGIAPRAHAGGQMTVRDALTAPVLRTSEATAERVKRPAGAVTATRSCGLATAGLLVETATHIAQSRSSQWSS